MRFDYTKATQKLGKKRAVACQQHKTARSHQNVIAGLQFLLRISKLYPSAFETLRLGAFQISEGSNTQSYITTVEKFSYPLSCCAVYHVLLAPESNGGGPTHDPD